MKSIIISLSLSVLLFFSCQQEVKKQEELRTFVIENFDGKKLEVEKHFPNVELLPLQLDTNQFVGKAKDVCMIGDTIFLLDEMTATIYSFDRKDGKCFHAVCKRGNGPNEYINPVALSVNADNLYVLDMPTSRIITFDKNLNAVGSVALDFPAFDFIALDTGFLLYNLAPTEERGKFVHINGKGTYINSFLPVGQENASSGMIGGVGKYFLKNQESDIFVFESYGDIVYKWEDELLKPIYRMDFGKLGVPTDVDKNKINLFEEPYAFVGSIFVLQDIFVPSFFYESKRYYGVVSLSGKELVAGTAKDGQYQIPFFPQWQHGDELIGVCRRESVEEYFKKYGMVEEVAADSEFVQEQPVLVFYSGCVQN